MSCNHCSTKFNFFHKEMGCNNCGLSFCNKCLKQKCKVPNKGSSELSVCRLCYSNLASGTSSNNQAFSPPDAFLKRLESLENPSAPPITVYKQNSKLQNLKKGLTPADLRLVERLEKLKEDKNAKPTPTELELRKRLANLKGENDYVEAPKKFLYTPDNRPDAEKADSLLEQFMSERDIELAQDPQERIEARLAVLREKGIRPNESQFLNELHDSSGSEEEISKITKKIMDEVALDEKYSKLTKKSDDLTEESLQPTATTPELPWCVLCNKDAKFKCFDCSGDLYCNECHIEVHKNCGYSDHKVVPFQVSS